MTVGGRAAIITGASSGIGYTIAAKLGERGYSLTINSRRPDRIGLAADRLRAEGYMVEVVVGDVGDEQVIKHIVACHRERFGRLDVLVNNAGFGIGQLVHGLTAKAIDLQLGVNLRQIPLFYREALDLLQAAGHEHGNAVVVNTSSITGKRAEPWVSVYSAAKAGVIAFTSAMNAELGSHGIKSCALCPAFVDTEMSSFAGDVGRDLMVQVDDIATMVSALLDLSPGCCIPEIVFESRTALGSTLP